MGADLCCAWLGWSSMGIFHKGTRLKRSVRVERHGNPLGAGPTNATCTCDAQCVCAAAGGTWIEAGPERERTCEGNSGCAGHTHSCTTPADPDGGFQSCTYKKHKGGLNCASHSHRTCEPFPATAAHCHIEIDPEHCPMCHPF